jgi:hypothetical protein
VTICAGPQETAEWQELDASSRRSSEMAKSRRGVCPAVDCSALMMIIMKSIIATVHSVVGPKMLSFSLGPDRTSRFSQI